MPISARVSIPVTRLFGSKPGNNSRGQPATILDCEIDANDLESIITLVDNTTLSVSRDTLTSLLERSNPSEIIDYLEANHNQLIFSNHADALQAGLDNLNWDEALGRISGEHWWNFSSEESVHDILTDDELADIILNCKLSLLKSACEDRGYALIVAKS